MKLKPVGEWNAMLIGLAVIPFVGFLFIVFSGECLNPYESCTAGVFDYVFPLFICLLLVAGSATEPRQN